MLLEAAAVNGLDAVVDTVDTQLIPTKAHHLAVLEMGGVRDGIVSAPVALVKNPAVAEQWDGPMSGWDVVERVKEQREDDELVDDESKQGSNSQGGKNGDRDRRRLRHGGAAGGAGRRRGAPAAEPGERDKISETPGSIDVDWSCDMSCLEANNVVEQE